MDTKAYTTESKTHGHVHVLRTHTNIDRCRFKHINNYNNTNAYICIYVIFNTNKGQNPHLDIDIYKDSKSRLTI